MRFLEAALDPAHAKHNGMVSGNGGRSDYTNIDEPRIRMSLGKIANRRRNADDEAARQRQVAPGLTPQLTLLERGSASCTRMRMYRQGSSSSIVPTGQRKKQV